MKNKKIIDEINQYYTGKILENGISPNGVDWNGKESQYLRFQQLSKVFRLNPELSLSVIDFGCGYGEYVNYLKSNYPDFTYFGVDISEKMLEAAQSLHQIPNCHFSQNIEDFGPKDYLIASGIFNVRNEISDADWKDYIEEHLHTFNNFTENGFSFNMLTSYSDKPFMKDYLFYADPLYYFDFCKKNFSRNVALLHDYELYEFTIIVRKN